MTRVCAIRGEEPGDAGDREQAEANQQSGPTAKAIRRRPIDQLTHSQSQDVDTDGQLQSGGRRVEVFGRGGQRGHEYVHADRPAEGEQPQEPERNGASADEFHRPAVAVCVRWWRSASSGKAQKPIPDRFEQAKRARQILVRHLAEDEVANVLGYKLDLIDGPTATRRQARDSSPAGRRGPRIARSGPNLQAHRSNGRPRSNRETKKPPTRSAAWAFRSARSGARAARLLPSNRKAATARRPRVATRAPHGRREALAGRGRLLEQEAWDVEYMTYKLIACQLSASRPKPEPPTSRLPGSCVLNRRSSTASNRRIPAL